MPQAETLRIHGYREFLRACDRAGKDTKKEVRGTFKSVGEIVRVDAAARFARYDARSAAGYRTRVRVRGVSVEQSLRRTTGNRGDYGALQQSKLEDSLAAQARPVEEAFEQAIDHVADHFDDAI